MSLKKIKVGTLTDVNRPDDVYPPVSGIVTKSGVYRMNGWNSLSTSEKVGEVLGAACVFAVPILMLFIGVALQS